MVNMDPSFVHELDYSYGYLMRTSGRRDVKMVDVKRENLYPNCN